MSEQAELNLVNVTLIDSSFETTKNENGYPDRSQDLTVKFEYDISKNKVSGDAKKGVFESILRGTLMITNKIGEPLFVAEASYLGVVEVKNLTEEQLDFVLSVDLVSQLEPSVKAFINQSLSAAGLPPFHRPPFNFLFSYQEQQKKKAEKASLTSKAPETIQ